MSTHPTLPAHAGAPVRVGRPWQDRLARALEGLIARWREGRELRRTLREIERLSDRELIDIGLSQGEIRQLRRGAPFQPMGWSRDDVMRDRLPF